MPGEYDLGIDVFQFAPPNISFMVATRPLVSFIPLNATTAPPEIKKIRPALLPLTVSKLDPDPAMFISLDAIFI